MKSQNPSKRNHLSAAIENLAKANQSAAQRMAMLGRRSPLEYEVWHYLFCGEVIKKPKEFFEDCRVWLEPMLPAKITWEKFCSLNRVAALRGALKSEKELSAILLDAVAKRDLKTLRSLAGAVKRFEKCPAFADHSRADMLFTNWIFEGEAMTTKERARLTGYKGEDLSWLRRLEKELNCPVAKDKTGRPKKGDS